MELVLLVLLIILVLGGGGWLFWGGTGASPVGYRPASGGFNPLGIVLLVVIVLVVLALLGPHLGLYRW
jgi:hypothetical protein